MRILACLILAASPAMADFRSVPCNGTYAVHSGQPMAQAQGLTMPVGQPLDTGAQVQMGQCGREMVLTIQGRPVVLNQSAMDAAIWSGAIEMGDGVARDVTLRLGADRNLRGALVAQDPNLRVNRPLWVILQTPEETRFDGCAPGSPAAPAPQAMGAEAAAVADLLTARGLVPAQGLGMADYLSVQRGTLDDRTVQLRLSDRGEILPSEAAALAQIDPESAHCLNDTRLIPARTVLEFQVNYAEGDPFVFARTVDIETSRITAQAEGVPQGSGLGSALADGLGKLAPALGPMSSGVSGN